MSRPRWSTSGSARQQRLRKPHLQAVDPRRIVRVQTLRIQPRVGALHAHVEGAARHRGTLDAAAEAPLLELVREVRRQEPAEVLRGLILGDALRASHEVRVEGGLRRHQFRLRHALLQTRTLHAEIVLHRHAHGVLQRQHHLGVRLAVQVHAKLKARTRLADLRAHRVQLRAPFLQFGEHLRRGPGHGLQRVGIWRLGQFTRHRAIHGTPQPLQFGAILLGRGAAPRHEGDHACQHQSLERPASLHGGAL
jgi:hypothetical protein